MSTYYYLLCHDCKVEIAAARQSSGNPAGPMDENLCQFIVDHRGHKVAITDEHEQEAQDYPHGDYVEYKPGASPS